MNDFFSRLRNEKFFPFRNLRFFLNSKSVIACATANRKKFLEKFFPERVSMCYSPGSKPSTFWGATSFLPPALVFVENAYVDGIGAFDRFHHLAASVFDVKFMLLTCDLKGI